MNIRTVLTFRNRVVVTVVPVVITSKHFHLGIISDLLALAGRRHRVHPALALAA